MKGLYTASVAIIFVCMVLFPLFSMRETVIPTPPQDDGEIGYEEAKTDEFRLLLTKEEKVITLSADDYICGVVSAEIGAESSEEALKAQAVAAYTFACRRKAMRTNEKYDMSDDYSTDQAYLSIDDMKARWGDNYEQYYNKVMSAVKSVSGEMLLYENKPILSVYHDISGGKTEAAENVWGEVYPCLSAVESVGDVLSPNYLSSVTVSVDDMKAYIAELDGSAEGDVDTWIGEPVRSPSGYVLNLTLGGKDISGVDIRKRFSLRSANFDVEYKEEGFVFTVRGNGHGVGMSQYGAQFMALQGSKYNEILAWYYPGATLQKNT